MRATVDLSGRETVEPTPLKGGGVLRVPWALAIPGLAAVLVFRYLAVGFGSFYAFTNWNGLGSPSWTGLANLRDIATDPMSRGALWHTLELVAAFVALVNVFGLALALALYRAVKTRHLLRMLFFAPVALSGLAVGFIWQWIFSYNGGLDQLLGVVGLAGSERPWLGDPATALWTILVVMVWQFSGLTMVLYLAGLQAISEDVVEATLVDGASPWFRFRKVVLPLLAPAVTVCVTLTSIIGLHVFDQVVALTGGGPVGASTTLAFQIYEQTFVLGRFGYGAAFSLIMALLVGLVAVSQVAVLRRREARL